MPRPKGSASQQARAYTLHNDGLGPTAIFDTLCDEFENPVSPRTVSTWLRGFRGLTEEVTELDAPFEYHRMEEYGLPWEAGGYLMEMWAWAREFWSDLYEKIGDPEPLPTTVRQASWWWRVHMMVPEETKFDVYVWAQGFAWQELLKDVLNETVDRAGLEARLAYRPWESPEKEIVYRQAVEQKRIPPLSTDWGQYMIFHQVGEIPGLTGLPLLGWDERPEALPSQIFEEYDAKIVQLGTAKGSSKSRNNKERRGVVRQATTDAPQESPKERTRRG